ncbi:MAG: peroxidase family protein [Pseudomonadota bacterium]
MSHSSGTGIKALAPRSKFYKGPFGRLCKNLPPWSPPGVPSEKLHDHFVAFANANMTERPNELPQDLADDAEALDLEFGSKDVPAGYTYFGQFVDHDITFDPTPLGVRVSDPNALDNFRTPRLDLDCVYGTGPSDQPFMYEKDGQFRIGKIDGTNIPDLPRTPAPHSRAIIGDMRNDENSIVAQVQLAFLLAHNRLVRQAKKEGLPNPFMAARRTLTWLYQWIVWHDFLDRVTINDVWNTALKKVTHPDDRVEWDAGLSSIYDWKNTPFMPIEFAVAAYRFGHSMVRNSYQTNFAHNKLDRIPLFANTTSAEQDVDADPQVEPDLRGFQPLRIETAIQWDWFLAMSTSVVGQFPQMARKIDTQLANALLFLGENDADPNSVENKLAARNLIRGVDMELPSGRDVAKCLGVTGKNPLSKGEPEALWFYILKEAQRNKGRLGRLGSTIVCAVFAGLLKGDPMSWINMDPKWEPETDPLLTAVRNDADDPVDLNQDFESSNSLTVDWGLPTIIRLAGLPSDGLASI